MRDSGMPVEQGPDAQGWEEGVYKREEGYRQTL